LNHLYGAEHSPAHAAGQADYVAISIPYGGDAVKGVVDASTVIPGKLTNAGYDIVNIRLVYLFGIEY
jgi:hypothetical protein